MTHLETKTSTARRDRRSVLVWCSACGLALAVCVLAWADQRGAADALRQNERAASRSLEDAQAIARLRGQPRGIGEAGLPVADLLSRVEQAMAAARLPRESLVTTLPLPKRHDRDTGSTEAGYRLMFERVELEPLVRFCEGLCAMNPQLRLDGLQLRALQPAAWNADVVLGYSLIVGADD